MSPLRLQPLIMPVVRTVRFPFLFFAAMEQAAAVRLPITASVPAALRLLPITVLYTLALQLISDIIRLTGRETMKRLQPIIIQLMQILP